MYALRFALLTLSVAALTACTTPRYQTNYSYEPPTDAAGRSCLAQCEQTQNTCLDECKEIYAACELSIEPEAKARYQDALKRYAGESEQYRRDLERYNLSLSLGWGHYDGWYGRGWYDPWWPYNGYYGPRYYPPLPPQTPSYAEEFAKLRQAQCSHDCGCQPSYDACFLGCGGRKVQEQRCFANCPPG